MESILQDEFDLTIGRLDRVLSKLVNWGRLVKKSGNLVIDEPNVQTLKHHAEDMIAAGQKILKDLGADVEGTPQPLEDVALAAGYCIRASGHTGPCNGLPRNDCFGAAQSHDGGEAQK